MCYYLLLQTTSHRVAATGGGSKGKRTEDPVKMLPVLPAKRSKPEWITNPPSFVLNGKQEPQDDNQIDLVYELTASKRIDFESYTLISDF